jgi:putative radical SAM enzyme (TIGR03279 family)
VKTVTNGLEIERVDLGSIAAELELEPGDYIVLAGRQPIRDLIDFTYACVSENLELTVRKKDGTVEVLEIEKELDEDLGLTFVQATADGIRRCRNNCQFCFVDQMPQGLRPSLYVKDDDWRLSVLQGSFVTLTNVSEKDLDRIVDLHLSPLYVSVHTLDGSLRQELMRNSAASKIQSQLQTLAQAGVEIHCQIVLCPGFNDGPALEYTLSGLAELWPAVTSVAAVPVGLTRYRKGLPQIRSYTAEQARGLIRWAQAEQEKFRRTIGLTFFHLADEFYTLAREELPDAQFYDGYPQLENGVGLIRRFLTDLEDLPPPPVSADTRSFTLVTGQSANSTLDKLAQWWNSFMGWHALVRTIPNDFWGHSVTVAGLLTGQDVVRALTEISPSGMVFLPAAMFNTNGLTLDNWTLNQIQSRLRCNLALAESPRDVWSQLVTGGEKNE